MPKIPAIIVKNFDKGLITRIEDESIARGATSDSMNWMSEGDMIVLRGGRTRLGADLPGVGRISGLRSIARFDGKQELFSAYGRKLRHYDADSETWEEIGTDTLPAEAADDDVVFGDYHSLAGAFAYVSSPNSSIYKIPAANPTSIVDQNSSSHRGKFRIKQGRMFLWDRKDDNGGFDSTGLYLSYVDRALLSAYPTVVAEGVASGNGATKTFTDTLATVSGVKTCMYVTITDGTETFHDDRNGVLVGNKGGSGTINYATGAFSVTFNTAPITGTNNITADYYTEDATDKGICDFSQSATRLAGEGAVFRQDDGGAKMENVGSIGGDEYCFHTLKTWRLTLSDDDTKATNLIYRSRVGIEYFRAMAESGAGLYYVDSLESTDAFIRVLKPSIFSEEVVPESISDQLDLSGYRFDRAVVFEAKKYLFVACRTKESTVNDRVLVYNKIWKLWDVTDFRVSVLDAYQEGVIAGDSGSNNVFELFKGLTDEGSKIMNHWISGEDNLGVEGVKSFNRFVLGGLIAPNQKIRVSFSFGENPFVEVGGETTSNGMHTYAIEGNGSYVDYNTTATIGSDLVGGNEIGGGGNGKLSPFRREFRVNTPIFEFLRLKIEAIGIGGVAITEYQIKDVRYKGQKLPPSKVTR